MTLRIFLNALSDTPYETHDLAGYETLGAWLAANVKDYDPNAEQRFAVETPDGPLALDEPLAGRDVRMILQPRGTDPFSITAALFKGVQAAFRAFMPKIPGVPNSNTSQGKSLSTANIRGNRVKLGDVIREVGGFAKVYPDYLVPQRSYFVNKTEQWVESLFCVGVGSFQFAPGGVKVGETSLVALDTAASFQIYEPGADLSGDRRSDWWHSAEEVGASSTGTAGLELTVSTAVTQGVTASSMQFNGATLTIPTGQGTFPDDWDIGQVIRIVAPYPYTFTDGATPTDRDIVTGPLGMVTAAPGDLIEIAISNFGSYEVETFDLMAGMTLNFEWGDPATSLTPGTFSAAIGPKGLLYRITNVDASARSYIQVERLTTAGTVDSGWSGFDPLTTGSFSVTLPPDAFEGGYRGPFPAVPENEVCTAFEVDVFFPSGLCGIGREGQIYTISGFYDVEWRDIAVGGAWNVVHISHAGGTRDQQGFTDRIDLPYAMRPEIRIKKVFVNQGGNSTSEYQDTMQWYNLRGRIDRIPRSYAGVTCLAVTLRSSDRIANQSESLISCEVTRKLPKRSGGSWSAPVATRDITAFAAYILNTLGYSDAQMNLPEFDALQSIWSSRGETFDAAITDTSTAKKVLNDVFGAGMGEYTMDGGKVRPVRDGVRTAIEAAYSPQNHTKGLTMSVSFPGPDDYDGCEVTFTNADTWQQDTVSYFLPGDQGLRVEKLSVVGVTDRTRAWRIAARSRRAGAYRRKTFKWSNELDGRVSRYLSYVLVSDDVPGFGQSALMRSFQVVGGATRIGVTEKFDWPGSGAVAAVRRPDGSCWGPYAATRIDDFTLSVPAVIDFTPTLDSSIEPPHVLFGELQRFAYPVLMTAINPNGMASTDMQAVGYDSRVYDEDNNSPP